MSAKTVRKIAKTAFEDAIDMLATVEVLSALNDRSLWQHLQYAGAYQAAIMIKLALLTRLIIWVARAYAPTRPNDLHARVAFELLNDREIAGQMTYPAEVAEAQDIWRRCRDDHPLQRVLHFRNTQLAHLGERRPDIEEAIIDDLFVVVRQTTRALEKLAQGSGATGLSLETQIPAYTKSTARFFAHWTNKGCRSNAYSPSL